jgi:hypothetical protein
VTTAGPSEEKNQNMIGKREWRKERKPDSKSRTDDLGIWKPETITNSRKLFTRKRFWKV